MSSVGWKTRIGLVLSAVWLLFVLLIADDYQRLAQVLALGLLPLVVIWGIVWAVKGWRAQRAADPTPDAATVAARRATRIARARSAAAVAVVLALGVLLAVWRFNSAGVESASNLIAEWLGEWSVYGLIAYAVLRALPGPQRIAPAVVAAIFVVGGVNWKTHAEILEHSEWINALARAAPIFKKINSGAPVQTQEVLDARTGLLEPMLLAQTDASRELLEISTSYRKSIAALDFPNLLSPPSLGTPDGRYQVRVKLQLFQQATAAYKSSVNASISRGRLGFQGAVQGLRPALARSAQKGYDGTIARMTEYVEKQVAISEDARRAAEDVVTLLDENPRSFVLVKGPPPNLLFKDEVTLAQYRRRIGTLLEAGKREQQLDADYAAAESKRLDTLVDFLKQPR